jgi:hypothetical protein
LDLEIGSQSKERVDEKMITKGVLNAEIEIMQPDADK